MIETKYDSLRSACCSMEVTWSFRVRVEIYKKGVRNFPKFVRNVVSGGSKVSF